MDERRYKHLWVTRKNEAFIQQETGISLQDLQDLRLLAAARATTCSIKVDVDNGAIFLKERDGSYTEFERTDPVKARVIADVPNSDRSMCCSKCGDRGPLRIVEKEGATTFTDTRAYCEGCAKPLLEKSTGDPRVS